MLSGKNVLEKMNCIHKFAVMLSVKQEYTELCQKNILDNNLFSSISKNQVIQNRK